MDNNNDVKTINQVFMSEDEHLVGDLGNGYTTNLVTDGNFKSVHGMVTNKRVYAKGKIYTFTNLANLEVTSAEKIIDLEDVTGTGFLYHSPNAMWLVTGILLLIFGTIYLLTAYYYIASKVAPFIYIVALIFILRYILKKKYLYFIEYAGGKIAFDAKLVGHGKVEQFNRSLRKAKDARKTELQEEQARAFKEALQNT